MITIGVLAAVAVAVVPVHRRCRPAGRAPDDAVLGWSAGGRFRRRPVASRRRRLTPGVVVYRFSGRLFFANSHFFKRRIWAAVDGAPKPVRPLVLDATGLSGVDASSVDALTEVLAGCTARNIIMDVAHATGDLRDRFDETGLAKSSAPGTSTPPSPRLWVTAPTTAARRTRERRPRRSAPAARIGRATSTIRLCR